MGYLRTLSLVLLAGSLACATASSGSQRPGETGEVGEGRAPGELRLMTYNIKSGTRGLDDVAEVIRTTSPDIVALQEVDRGSRRSGRLDQAAVLAERAGLPYHAHFRTRDVSDGAYGIALLSRFPLEAVEQYPLPFLPAVRIDYVMASDSFIPLRSRVPRVDASDHYPVIADVRLKEDPAPAGEPPENELTAP